MSTTSNALSGIWTPRPHSPDPAYLAYCSARQAHNVAQLNWLNTKPDPDLVREEVTGSIKAIHDIAWLRGVVLK